MRASIHIALMMVGGLLLAACASSPASQPRPTTMAFAVNTPRQTGSTAGQMVFVRQALPTATPNPTSTPVDTRPDITVWWPAAVYPDADSPAYETLLGQFDSFRQTADRSLFVRERRLDGTGGIVSTLRTASAVAPTALPDLALMPREEMTLAAEAGLIYPLDDLLPPTIARDLYSQALALGRINDVTFGVPYTLQIQHIVYRETVFNPPPTSLQAVLQAHQPFAFTAAPPTGVSETFLIQYIAAGGHVVGDDGRPVLDEAPLLETLTFYEEAVAAGLTGPAALNYQSPQNYWDSFLSGALSLVQTDSTTYLAAHGPIPNVTVGPIPTQNEQPATTLRGWMWVLTTPDPDRQAQALDFLDWIMRAENQAEFTQAYGVLPSQRPALRIWDNSDYTDLVDRLLNMPDPILIESINTTMATTLQNALTAVLSGEQSAAEATAEALASLQ